MIEREIVSFDSNVHWDDIAGMSLPAYIAYWRSNRHGLLWVFTSSTSVLNRVKRCQAPARRSSGIAVMDARLFQGVFIGVMSSCWFSLYYRANIGTDHCSTEIECGVP